MVTREGNVGVWVKRSRSTNLYLQKNYKGVKYITGHIGKNIIVIMCGAKWVIEILGRSLCKLFDSKHYAVHQNLYKILLNVNCN